MNIDHDLLIKKSINVIEDEYFVSGTVQKDHQKYTWSNEQKKMKVSQALIIYIAEDDESIFGIKIKLKKTIDQVFFHIILCIDWSNIRFSSKEHAQEWWDVKPLELFLSK